MQSSQVNAAEAFFEERYRKEVDPWNFRNSEYEKARFATLLQSLAPRQYRRAFEPGCSIGTLTERLATVCDAVEACDLSPTAVMRAAERCVFLKHVHVFRAPLSRETTVSGYDLIVLSEIGYYFSTEEWRDLVNALTLTMDEGTTVLASHWLGQAPEHQQSGDAVHQCLRADGRLLLEYEERHAAFRLDRFVRR